MTTELFSPSYVSGERIPCIYVHSSHLALLNTAKEMQEEGNTNLTIEVQIFVRLSTFSITRSTVFLLL